MKNNEGLQDNNSPIVQQSVTRVEVIDHTKKDNCRCYVKYDAKVVSLSYQDDGRTLKIFIS